MRFPIKFCHNAVNAYPVFLLLFFRNDQSQFLLVLQRIKPLVKGLDRQCHRTWDPTHCRSILNVYKDTIIIYTNQYIPKTYLYNFDPLKPHFYILKLGFTGVYIIFLITAQKT